MPARAHLARLIGGDQPAPAGRRAVSALILVAVAVATAAAMADTMPELGEAGWRWAGRLQAAAAALFAVEYLVRLWTAPEDHPAGAGRPWHARRAYAASALGVIDLLAVVPLALDLAAAPRLAADLVALVGLLKLVRYASGLSLVLAVMRNERRPLMAALVVMAVLLVFASAAMFALEHAAQPAVFTSIPRSLWWGIVTIASVGYGDMTPVTVGGRLVGGLVMLLGIAMFAVPAGILATGFAAELRRRDFVVTWQTVARVPLFATLDAGAIAEIARLLEPRLVPAHSVLVRRGQTADAMYFVMEGEVEVDLQPRPVRLGKGQFFGEIALLRDTVRTATVTTLTECQLLELNAGDFRRLIERMPDLKARITETARRRLDAQAGDAPPRG